MNLLDGNFSYDLKRWDGRKILKKIIDFYVTNVITV
jgi:hypothetical protein